MFSAVFSAVFSAMLSLIDSISLLPLINPSNEVFEKELIVDNDLIKSQVILLLLLLYLTK